MAEPTSTLPAPSDSDSLPMRPPSAEPKPLDTVEDATSMAGAIPAPSETPADNKDLSSSKPTVESGELSHNGFLFHFTSYANMTFSHLRRFGQDQRRRSCCIRTYRREAY
jgi:hypothetical protein